MYEQGRPAKRKARRARADPDTGQALHASESKKIGAYQEDEDEVSIGGK